MYQLINDPIDVAMVFKAGKAEPVSFKWGGRFYEVKMVNAVHHERQGREKIYIFSVSDEANAYRLKFYTETLKWEIEETAVL